MPELLNGPLFSILLVILAGIALRYALWYGNDEKKSSATKPTQTTTAAVLADATGELRSQLAESQADHRQLQEKYQHLAGDYNAFKEAADRQQAEWRDNQRSCNELENAVAQLRSSQEHAIEELNTERGRRQDAERQLEALTGEMNHMRHELDLLIDERDQQDGQLQQMQSLQETAITVDQIRGEYEDDVAVLREKLQEKESAYAQLCTEFDQQREALAQQETIITGHQESTGRQAELVTRHEESLAARAETITRLETILAERDETAQQQARTIAQLETTIAEYQQAAAQQEQTRTGLETTLAEHQYTVAAQEQAIARLEVEARFADDLREQHAATKLSLGEVQSRLVELDNDKQALSDQLDDAKERIHHLQSQLSVAHDESQRLEIESQHSQSLAHEEQTNAKQYADQYEAQREKIRALRTEKEELLNGLHREQDLRHSFESQLTEARGTVTRLQKEAAEAARLRGEQQEMTQELESTRSRVTRLDESHDNLTIALGRSERRVSELERKSDLLEHEAVSQESTLKRLRDQNNQLAQVIENEKQARSRTEHALRVHVETLERLRMDSESLESLLERQAAVQSSLQEHADRLRSVASDVESRRSVGDVPPGVLSIETARSTPENPSQDPALGTVYTRPPLHRDDLKRISGVGEVLEEKLNRLGIYRYEQIMNWSDKAIAEFSKLLAFKDRIEREQWVAQARGLFLEENNQAA